MGEEEITRFLSALAVHGQVSASRQHQALCALVFLSRHVLGQNFGGLEDVVRAKRPQRLPVVLTRPEVRALLGALEGVHWITVSLLYGAGLRLLECLRLRVKAIDFASHQILLREGKGPSGSSNDAASSGASTAGGTSGTRSSTAPARFGARLR
jgi:integrase